MQRRHDWPGEVVHLRGMMVVAPICMVGFFAPRFFFRPPGTRELAAASQGLQGG